MRAPVATARPSWNSPPPAPGSRWPRPKPSPTDQLRRCPVGRRPGRTTATSDGAALRSLLDDGVAAAVSRNVGPPGRALAFPVLAAVGEPQPLALLAPP